MMPLFVSSRTLLLSSFHKWQTDIESNNGTNTFLNISSQWNAAWHQVLPNPRDCPEDVEQSAQKLLCSDSDLVSSHWLVINHILTFSAVCNIEYCPLVIMHWRMTAAQYFSLPTAWKISIWLAQTYLHYAHHRMLVHHGMLVLCFFPDKNFWL